MHRTHFAVETLKHWTRAITGREQPSGQSMVLLAIGLVALLGFAGLVFDGGTAYAEFRRMQNAADAGALAGATELSKKSATTNAEVCRLVNEYAAQRNGTARYGGQIAPLVKIQYFQYNSATKETKLIDPPIQDPDQNILCEGNNNQPNPNARGVRATVTTKFNTWFLGLFGNPTGTAIAHASAQYGPARPMIAQPLAKRCDDPSPGAQCGLKKGDPPEDIWESDQPGNFGWLAFNGDNDAQNLAGELALDLTTFSYIDSSGISHCEYLAVNCWVKGGPGIKNAGGNKENEGTVTRALQDWIDSGKPMIIILYDQQIEGGQNSQYHIVGFAAFYPTSFKLAPDNVIMGTFDYYLDSAPIDMDANDTGYYSVRLIPDVLDPIPDPPTNGRICVSVINDLGGDGTINPDRDFYVEGAHIWIYDANSGGLAADWISYGVSTNCVEKPKSRYYVVEQNAASLPANSPGYPDNPPGFELAAGGIQDVYFLDYAPTNGTFSVEVHKDSLAGPAFEGASITVLDSTSRVAGLATTSVTGTVFFRYLPLGMYSVSASAANYQPNVASQSINLTGTITTPLKFYMSPLPTGRMDISVVDDSGNPVIGAVINISGPISSSRNTDSTGHAVFDGIPTGSYTVKETNLPGYTSDLDTVTVNVPTSPTATWIFYDTLPKKGTICVLVYDDITGDGNWTSGERALAGVTVNILLNGKAIGTWITNGAEPYCYQNMPANTTYTVVSTLPSGYYATNPRPSVLAVYVADKQKADAWFGMRLGTPTPTLVPTKTPVPSKTPVPTNTPVPTAGPSPTPTMTPIPGALCVTVYQDTNSNGLWDTTPPPTPTPPGAVPPFTPEATLAPQAVTVMNPKGTPTSTWNGAGAQPYCFNGLWPGSYSAVETDPFGYSSTTANTVAGVVQSSASTSLEFGDRLCQPRTPEMYQPIKGTQPGTYWLQWENVGPLMTYEIFGSFTCESASCSVPPTPTPAPWHSVIVVNNLNYEVVATQNGIFYYVVAHNNCGTSGPSNVVGLSN